MKLKIHIPFTSFAALDILDEDLSYYFPGVKTDFVVNNQYARVLVTVSSGTSTDCCVLDDVLAYLEHYNKELGYDCYKPKFEYEDEDYE